MSIDDADRVVLDGPAIEAEGLADWRVLLGALHARFETGGFNAGVTLVQAIAAAADEMDHHPDVELTYPRVTVRLSSHDVGGVTRRDVVLARAISEMAARLGAAPSPSVASVLELGLDTWDAAAIAPFWAAVLGYDQHDAPGEPIELVDPSGTRPPIWFQESDEHAVPHQRWHLDLRVPPEVVEPRIVAALEAGGTLVSDAAAPRFWVLADPQGNQVCLTTWQGRTHA
jgi:4a-hydroxytetrahydrobiopterin dehydratase